MTNKVFKNGTEISIYRDRSLKGRKKDGTPRYHDCYRADISEFVRGKRTARTRRRFKTLQEAKIWLSLTQY